MNKPYIVWARTPQDGKQLYKVAGIDDQGILNIVFDIATNERTEYLLRTLRILLEKYDFDREAQWWKDLVTLTDLARFWIARQYEARAIGKKQENNPYQKADTILEKSGLCTPYSHDKHILSPQNPLWTSFVTKLLGPSGISFNLCEGKVSWVCDHTLNKTAAILNEYIDDGIDVIATLDFFQEHDGTCDCKVLFDVTTNFYRSPYDSPGLEHTIKSATPEYTD